MKAKESKEVAVARLSARQAVIVALISLLSAVTVAFIANFDKLVGEDGGVKEETAYYEGRAGNVTYAFREKEEELQARSESAQEAGKLEEAGWMRKLADEVRAEEIKFRERHQRHLAALGSRKRLEASEIKTEANEAITKLNQRLYQYIEAPEERQERAKRISSQVVRQYLKQRLIPLYGKGSVKHEQEEVCQMKNVESTEGVTGGDSGPGFGR